ncbi:hypothetical protein Scep_015611 [Stephania cephalantha]|uniref:Uncharacterized protein n=1 Tax=Stephania cephalantha TaxID=152367 RepID=A0AAP0J4X9_9MAGN
MADALSVIPTAVLRNLSDKLYEKRNNAAQEGGLIGLAAATVETISKPYRHSNSLVTHSRADWRRTPSIRNQLHIWILVKGTYLISVVSLASELSS